MPENVTSAPELFCRECGQKLSVIQQPAFDGGYIPLVTCWQKSCLLYAVTLSVNQYARLNDADLEAYREMNRVSRPKFVKGDNK